MIFKVLGMLMLLYSNILFSQELYKLSIPLDTNVMSSSYKNFYISSKPPLPSNIEISKKGNYLIKAIIFGEFGKMKIQFFDSLKNIYIEGQFTDGLDSLKEQVFSEKVNGDIVIAISKYFQPIINGIWSFYDFYNKRLICKRYYLDGFEVSLEKYNSLNLTR